jgi:antitoxin ParD1/3/4
MNISLSADQRAWLEAEVAAGRFTSVNEAVAAAVASLMDLEADDFAWAKPMVDQARASVAKGNVVPGEDYLKRLATKAAKLQSA